MALEIGKMFRGLANRLLIPREAEFKSLSGELEAKIGEITGEVGGLGDLEKSFNDYLKEFAAQFTPKATSTTNPLEYLDNLREAYNFDRTTFSLNKYLVVGALYGFLKSEVARKKNLKPGEIGEEQVREQVRQAIDDGLFNGLTEERIQLLFLRTIKHFSDIGVKELEGPNYDGFRKREAHYDTIVRFLYKVDQKTVIERVGKLAHGIIDKEGLKAITYENSVKNPFKTMGYGR